MFVGGFRQEHCLSGEEHFGHACKILRQFYQTMVRHDKDSRMDGLVSVLSATRRSS